MAQICPTILATTKEDYRAQVGRIESFAKRVQIDLTDGDFVATKTVPLANAWYPKDIKIDLHLMYKRPTLQLKKLVELKPHMVIVHAEGTGNFFKFAAVLHKYDIKVGVALLPKTPLENIKPALDVIDHILIFSGKLGKFGGSADTSLLAKAQEAKELKPSVEIGWDGGVNDTNAHLLAAGGVDVLNVGGFIQKASDPKAAYAKLKAQLG